VGRPPLDGRYALREKLGEGGMGEVWRARDLELRRDVAIKLARPGLEDQDDRLDREARALSRLDDPGLVRVFAVGRDRGRPYVVMELVEGARTLEEALPGASRRVRLDWVAQAAEALGAAHRAGVAHRDVKPENVLIDGAGRARVGDFGLALLSDRSRLTATGELVGTPLYMAPEQLGARREAQGPATDVWGLGALLYEALTGAAPFAAANLPELVSRVERGPPRPSARAADVPQAVEEVCLRALRSRPADRYPDGAAFVRALERARRPAPSPPPSAAGASPTAAAGVVLAAGALVALAVWGAGRGEPAATPRPAAGPGSASSGGRERPREPATASSARGPGRTEPAPAARAEPPGAAGSTGRVGPPGLVVPPVLSGRALVRLADGTLVGLARGGSGREEPRPRRIDLWSSGDDGRTWTRTGGPASERPDQAALAARGQELHLVYRAGGRVHYARRGPAGRWSRPEPLFAPEGDAGLFAPRVVVDARGTPWALAHRGGGWDGFARRARPGGGWTAPERIARPTTRYAFMTSLAAGSDGSVHASYRSLAGALPDPSRRFPYVVYGIRYRRWDPERAAWGPEWVVAEHTGSGSAVRVAAGGTVHVVSARKEPAPREASRLRERDPAERVGVIELATRRPRAPFASREVYRGRGYAWQKAPLEGVDLVLAEGGAPLVVYLADPLEPSPVLCRRADPADPAGPLGPERVLVPGAFRQLRALGLDRGAVALWLADAEGVRFVRARLD